MKFPKCSPFKITALSVNVRGVDCVLSVMQDARG
jgi:hypothetical protein